MHFLLQLRSCAQDTRLPSSSAFCKCTYTSKHVHLHLNTRLPLREGQTPLFKGKTAGLAAKAAQSIGSARCERRGHMAKGLYSNC